MPSRNIEWGKAIYAARAYPGHSIAERTNCFVLVVEDGEDAVCTWDSRNAERAQRDLKRASRQEFGVPPTNEHLALIECLYTMSRVGCSGPAWGCRGPEHEHEDMVTCYVCQTIHEVRQVLDDAGVVYDE